MGTINILKETTVLMDKKDDIGYKTYCSNVSRLKSYISNNTNKKNRNRFYMAIKEQRNISGSQYFVNRLYKFLNLYKSHGVEFVVRYLEYELLAINIIKSKTLLNKNE